MLYEVITLERERRDVPDRPVAVEYPIAENAKVKGKVMRQAVAALKEGREAMMAFIIAARNNFV